MTMRHILTINGFENPMRQRFGCECERCRDKKRVAHTSVSLLTLNEAEQLIHHILFDVGAGVRESLIENPRLAPPNAHLDLIALTHWHPDHTHDLWFLADGIRWSQKVKGLAPKLVPVWARQASMDWLKASNKRMWPKMIRPIATEENEPPGTLLQPLPHSLPDVTITPLTLSHIGADINPHDFSQKAYATTGFIIETGTSRTALLWDVDTKNEWLWQQITPQLQNLDHLFIDCTTWDAPQRFTRALSHISFQEVQKIARIHRPRQTWLMHMGGHLSGPGAPGYGWTDARWQREAAVAWEKEGLEGQVFVGSLGREISL